MLIDCDVILYLSLRKKSPDIVQNKSRNNLVEINIHFCFRVSHDKLAKW